MCIYVYTWWLINICMIYFFWYDDLHCLHIHSIMCNDFWNGIHVHNIQWIILTYIYIFFFLHIYIYIYILRTMVSLIKVLVFWMCPESMFSFRHPFAHKTPQSEVSKLSASTEKSEPAIERTGFTTWNGQIWSHGLVTNAVCFGSIPQPSTGGKWRFVGIPHFKLNGDCC